MNKKDFSDKEVSFKSLGILDELCAACESMGWKSPTAIQKEAIPISLKDRDVIGLAETGSGKTGAFALPILQSLILHPRKPFALILSPTRELAIQIKEQFEALGRDIGLSCCAVVGGMDMDLQSRELSKHPHIIVATPGRLVNHIFKTKSLRLDKIEYLVMDEADRILALGFGNDLDKIISEVPCVRRTMLFSATMTNKIKKLQRAHLRNPVKVEVSSKFQTVNKLQQKMIFMAFDLKTVYLIYLLKQIGSESVILLCSTCNTTLRIALLLRSFGFSAIPIHSKMSQSKRMSAITKFKTKDRSILVGTDVISRGLDVPNVDYIINFDLPLKSKDYIHRVGRTARAGRAGTAITFVSQYEVETFQRLEHVLGVKMDVYPVDEPSVLALKESVIAADKESKLEMKRILDEGTKGKRGKGNSDDEDDQDQAPRKRKK